MKETIKLGKYELSHENGCNLKCTRDGEDWRNLVGDNLVLQMFQRIQELENSVDLLETENSYLEDHASSLEQEVMDLE